jgi:acetyl-CoA C-acetyltransferase
MKISILGEHISQFGELWDKSLRHLLYQSATQAITSADLKPTAIEAIFVANMGAGILENQLHLGALVSSFFPHHPPAFRVEGACASGGLAVLTAQQFLLSGRFQTVLVVGAEKMTDVSLSVNTKFLTSAGDFNREYGSTFPVLYALLTQAHMQKYGTTRDMLSAVSVKNHHHALANPKAQFHKEFSLSDVNQSELIADPIRLLDCSPVSDGASSLVLTAKKTRSPQILASAYACDSLTLADRQSLTQLQATKIAADQCYQQSGIDAGDVEMAEVHDCFTISEILATEDLGFFKKGQGGPACLSGRTTYGGKIVINPSGGLKACGHPVGATGIKQIAYISNLIRHKKINIGLTHNLGGSGATAVVHLLGGKL